MSGGSGGGGIGGGAGQHMIPSYDSIDYDDGADSGDILDDHIENNIDIDDDKGVTRVRRNVSDFDYNLGSANCYSPPGPEMGYSARTVVTYQTELVGTGRIMFVMFVMLIMFLMFLMLTMSMMFLVQVCEAMATWAGEAECLVWACLTASGRMTEMTWSHG